MWLWETTAAETFRRQWPYFHSIEAKIMMVNDTVSFQEKTERIDARIFLQWTDWKILLINSSTCEDPCNAQSPQSSNAKWHKRRAPSSKDKLPQLHAYIYACRLLIFRTLSWNLYTKTECEPRQREERVESGSVEHVLPREPWSNPAGTELAPLRARVFNLRERHCM
jgi:hypothetical protein